MFSDLSVYVLNINRRYAFSLCKAYNTCKMDEKDLKHLITFEWVFVHKHFACVSE